MSGGDSYPNSVVSSCRCSLSRRPVVLVSEVAVWDNVARLVILSSQSAVFKYTEKRSYKEKLICDMLLCRLQRTRHLRLVNLRVCDCEALVSNLRPLPPQPSTPCKIAGLIVCLCGVYSTGALQKHTRANLLARAESAPRPSLNIGQMQCNTAQDRHTAIVVCIAIVDVLS